MATPEQIASIAQAAHAIRPEWAWRAIATYLEAHYGHHDHTHLTHAVIEAAWDRQGADTIAALAIRGNRYWTTTPNRQPPQPSHGCTCTKPTCPKWHPARPGVPPPPGTTAADIAQQLAERRRTCEDLSPESGVVVS